MVRTQMQTEAHFMAQLGLKGLMFVVFAGECIQLRQTAIKDN